MTNKENITAILECYFAGFKKEIIDSACNRILEQEPKTGHWIVETGDRETGYGGCTMCSECSGEGNTEMDYCPHCGAKMESEDKE